MMITFCYQRAEHFSIIERFAPPISTLHDRVSKYSGLRSHPKFLLQFSSSSARRSHLPSQTARVGSEEDQTGEKGARDEGQTSGGGGGRGGIDDCRFRAGDESFAFLPPFLSYLLPLFRLLLVFPGAINRQACSGQYSMVWIFISCQSRTAQNTSHNLCSDVTLQMESESEGMASPASGLAAFKSVCLIGGSSVYGSAEFCHRPH